jgi:hypothetical protein
VDIQEPKGDDWKCRHKQVDGMSFALRNTWSTVTRVIANLLVEKTGCQLADGLLDQSSDIDSTKAEDIVRILDLQNISSCL